MILEGVQKYENSLRYPIPKFLPSGKGLAIASLQCFTLIVILTIIVIFSVLSLNLYHIPRVYRCLSRYPVVHKSCMW